MDWLFGILLVGFIVVSVALIIIILVQRPQGGGLAAAFGGSSGGGTDTAFGGRTGDVLTITTVGAFVLYLVVAIGLNIISNMRVQASMAGTETQDEPAVATDTPATGPADISPAAIPGPSDSPATGPADIAPSDIPASAAPAGSEPAPAAEPAPASEPAPGN